MKPDYKNWVPRGMVAVFLTAAALLLLCLLLFGVMGLGVSRTIQRCLAAGFGVAFLICAGYALWCVMAYRAFSYAGKRQMSRQIIEGIAGFVILPEGGRGLDVGCGSGALTIACAKRNQRGAMTGLDRWGKEYASFNKPLCEQNAVAEGVRNVTFVKGDAVRLEFPDECFDAVTSNYVYHNIMGVDRQGLLLETLRVLKKGGVFAIHDIMSPARYGDMTAFVERLKEQGYEEVRLIDTAKGMFMSPKEAKWLALSGSMLLVGRK